MVISEAKNILEKGTFFVILEDWDALYNSSEANYLKLNYPRKQDRLIYG